MNGDVSSIPQKQPSNPEVIKIQVVKGLLTTGQSGRLVSWSTLDCRVLTVPQPLVGHVHRSLGFGLWSHGEMAYEGIIKSK